MSFFDVSVMLESWCFFFMCLKFSKLNYICKRSIWKIIFRDGILGVREFMYCFNFRLFDLNGFSFSVSAFCEFFALSVIKLLMEFKFTRGFPISCIFFCVYWIVWMELAKQ